MLADIPLRDLLSALASPTPTPGGGSAAALAGAVGVALLRMVTALPRTRAGTAQDRVALEGAASALSAIQQQLTAAIDRDAAAYDAVVGASRLPKTTEEEQRARTAAVQEALCTATDVPLDVMRLSNLALAHGVDIAAHGHRAAASDVGVAIALLDAAFRGARLNVEINASNIAHAADQERIRATLADVNRQEADALAAAQAALNNFDQHDR